MGLRLGLGFNPKTVGPRTAVLKLRCQNCSLRLCRKILLPETAASKSADRSYWALRIPKHGTAPAVNIWFLYRLDKNIKILIYKRNSVHGNAKHHAIIYTPLRFSPNHFAVQCWPLLTESSKTCLPLSPLFLSSWHFNFVILYFQITFQFNNSLFFFWLFLGSFTYYHCFCRHTPIPLSFTFYLLPYVWDHILKPRLCPLLARKKITKGRITS